MKIEMLDGNPSNTGSMFIEVLPVPMRPVRATEAGGAERVCASPLVLNLGSVPPSIRKAAPKKPNPRYCYIGEHRSPQVRSSRDRPLSPLPCRASRDHRKDGLSSIRASLGAMLDDCFGAKPEADEHSHELRLSAESGRNVPLNPRAAVLIGRLTRGVFDRRMHGHRLGAKHVIAAFACQRRGAAARRLIKIKAVELLLSRRCDREVAIRPAIRCCEDCCDDRFAISKHRPAALRRE